MSKWRQLKNMDKICKNMGKKHKIKLEGLIEIGHKTGAKCFVDRIHIHIQMFVEII